MSASRRGILAGLLSAASVAAYAQSARILMRAGAASPPAPTSQLFNVAYGFGALTKAGNGQVRLSGLDNAAYGQPFSGLGLLNPLSASPATWTVKQVSGTAGHWALNGNTITSSGVTVPEGSTALTPTPSASGVTAKLNGGPYVFQVFMVDVLGVTSNTVTITVTAVANAINIGNSDLLKVANMMTSIAAWNAAGGNAMYFSVGLDRTNVRNALQGLSFTSGNPTTLAWSDPARPGGITTIEMSPATYLTISGITLVGSLAAMGGNYLGGFYLSKGCDHVTLAGCGAINNAALLNATGIAVVIYGASNITINDFVCQWFAGFIQENNGVATAVTTAVPSAPNDNVAINRAKVRYICNNYVFKGNGQNWSFTDCKFASPMRLNGTHIDYFQFVNGGSPVGLTITRLGCYQADGTASCQGIFGGTPTGTVGPNFQGYIDDGTGTGTPGNILTVTQVGTKSPWTPYAKVIGDTPGVVNAATQIGWLQSATGFQSVTLIPLPGSKYVLLGPAQLVGSAAAPVNMYSAPFDTLAIDGFIFGGIDTNVLQMPGLSNSSIRHFTCIKNISPAPNSSVATGHVSGTTLTLDSDMVGPFGAIVGSPVYQTSDLTTSLGTISSLLSGTLNRAGSTYKLSASHTVSSQSLTFSFDISGANGPWLRLDDATIGAMYPNVSPVSSGYMGDALQSTGGPPVNVTIGADVQYGHTASSFTLQSTLFALGDPSAIAVNGSHTAAIWAAMTIDQVATQYATFVRPKASSTFNGTIASGQPTLTVTSGSIPATGSLINGPGLAGNTTVLSVAGSVLTLSANASASSTAQPFGVNLLKADGSYIGALTSGGLWNDGSGQAP